MTEPLFLKCRGFDENVVLTLKTCFHEQEMRKILIEKEIDKVTYHDRLCSNLVPYEGHGTRLVSVQCNEWFNSLNQLYLPQLQTTHEDFELFEQDNDNSQDSDNNEADLNCNGDEAEKDIDSTKLDSSIEKLESDSIKTEKAEEKITVISNLISDLSNFLSDNESPKAKPEKHYECDICGRKFLKMKSLGIHKGRRHKASGEPNFVCTIEDCSSLNKKFSNQLQLKKHMRQVHKLPKRGRKPKPKQDFNFEDDGLASSMACEVCGKIFDSATNLYKHVKRSHETSQKPCHICGMMVKELSIHVKHQHTQKDMKKYFCEFCGRGFKGYSGYQFHVAGHTGEKKYNCGGCSKSFRTSSESKKCERGHQGIYKWNCSLCSYRCHQRNKFVRHMRTHTKSEPYGCPLCEHRAARKDYLQKHITKSHTGVSLEQVEGLHPNMYDIQEKVSFVEGRESRSTEDIQERVREGRLSLARGKRPQQEDQVDLELEDELGELVGEQELSGEELLIRHLADVARGDQDQDRTVVVEGEENRGGDNQQVVVTFV